MKEVLEAIGDVVNDDAEVRATVAAGREWCQAGMRERDAPWDMLMRWCRGGQV